MPSMLENINSGKYKPTATYVPLPRLPKELRKPASLMLGPELKACREIEDKYKAEKEAAIEAGRPYREQQQKCLEQFEHDCAEACGVLDNPKRNLLFQKAWERGHANGLSDVWNYYSDLSDLILPVNYYSKISDLIPPVKG